MDEIILETSASPKVIILADDKLRITGWDRNEVLARTRGKDDLSMKKDGEEVRIEATAACDVQVPVGALLEIQAVHGDAYVKDVSGRIHVQQATDALILQNTGAAFIGFVGSELNAKNVAGDLSVKQVGSYVNVRNVSGNFTADFIGAHLNLREVVGDISAEAGANATLHLSPQPGQTVTVQTYGVMLCYLPSDTNADLYVKAHGPITCKVGKISHMSTDGKFNATLGEGGAAINLSAHGPTSIFEPKKEQEPPGSFNFSFDFEPFVNMGTDFAALGQEIAEQFTEQVDSQMEMLNIQLEHLSESLNMANISPEKAEKISQRARERAQRAREKINQAARKAQEKTTRKMASAQRRAERQDRMAERQAARSSRRSSSDVDDSQAEPVSDAERMMILQMLAENKISTAEAEKLLSALEG